MSARALPSSSFSQMRGEVPTESASVLLRNFVGKGEWKVEGEPVFLYHSTHCLWYNSMSFWGGSWPSWHHHGLNSKSWNGPQKIKTTSTIFLLDEKRIQAEAVLLLMLQYFFSKMSWWLCVWVVNETCWLLYKYDCFRKKPYRRRNKSGTKTSQPTLQEMY